MAEWWEAAPVVEPAKGKAAGGNWWDAAPVVSKKPKRGERRGAAEEVSGFMANVNRGLLIGDEVAAGLMTAADLVTGKIKPRVGKGQSPVGMGAAVGGLVDGYQNALARQRGMEDEFTARRPIAAGVGKGLGTGATILVPGGSAAAAPNALSAAARGATIAAGQGYAAGMLDRGTMAERSRAGATNALIAAPIGAALPLAVNALSRGPKPTAPKAPSLEELSARKNAAYRAVDDSGVTYAPEAFDDMVAGIGDEMRAASISPMRHPKAASMLADLEKMRGRSPSITELDQLRQVIRRDVASSADDAERFFGQKMIANIDEFIGAAGPEQVIAGNADDAASLINNARDLNTRVRKVESVQEAVDSARLRAGSTGSGGNVDNATRQNLRRVLETTRNLTADERAALEGIVMGSPGQNLLRNVGKLSPQGSGLMAAGNLGAAAIAGPLGAIPGGAGMVSKWAADEMTQRKVRDLVNLMAMGGQRGLGAEEELAMLAANDPAIARIYQQVADRLARATGSLTNATQQPQNALATAPQ